MILNRLSFHRKLITKAAQVAVRSVHTSNPLRKNLYEVLGLTRDATQMDIKNAYFELSKIYHPDRIAATDENLAKFREISDAYEILGNEQSRKLYDRGLVGDFKRAGTDDTSEVMDPIVRFYKRRHEATKPKAQEDMEAWAEAYYKEAKLKAEKKNKYYVVSRKREYEQDHPNQDILFFCISMILGFFFLSNYKNSKAEKLWNMMCGTYKYY